MYVIFWFVGEVTCWQEADLAYVRAVMNHDVPQLKAAGIAPQIDHIQRLSEILDAFSPSYDEPTQDQHTATHDDNGVVNEVSPQFGRDIDDAANLRDLVATTKSSVAESTQTNASHNTKNALEKGTTSQNPEYKSKASQRVGASTSTKVQLSSLLLRFVDLCKIDGPYFMCNQSNVATVANWLHTIPLTLADRYEHIIKNISYADCNKLLF